MGLFKFVHVLPFRNRAQAASVGGDLHEAQLGRGEPLASLFSGRESCYCLSWIIYKSVQSAHRLGEFVYPSRLNCK